jgi:hypothetical protein
MLISTLYWIDLPEPQKSVKEAQGFSHVKCWNLTTKAKASDREMPPLDYDGPFFTDRAEAIDEANRQIEVRKLKETSGKEALAMALKRLEERFVEVKPSDQCAHPWVGTGWEEAKKVLLELHAKM